MGLCVYFDGHQSPGLTLWLCAIVSIAPEPRSGRLGAPSFQIRGTGDGALCPRIAAFGWPDFDSSGSRMRVSPK